MKNVIILTAIILLAFTAQAQKNENPMLKSYYEIKDALVNADGATASAKAGEMIKVMSADSKDKLPALSKLVVDVHKIAGTQDVAKQREIFANLSLNMYALAKSEKLSDDTIYQQYCPMKKTYWLSNEAAIKNPYYGKMMLTCGNVADTIKP